MSKRGRIKDDFLVDAGPDTDEDEISDQDGLAVMALGRKAKSGSSKSSSRGKSSSAKNLLEEDDGEQDSDEDRKEETADEKRIRLLKKHLESIGANIEGDDSDDSDASKDGDKLDEAYVDDPTARLLRKEALRAKGFEQRRPVAHKFKRYDYSAAADLNSTAGSRIVKVLRGPRLTPTCVALTEDGKTVFCGAKDASITSWSMSTNQRRQFNLGAKKDPSGVGHTGSVLSLALSSDGVFLASTGSDKTVRVWDVESGRQLKVFREHRDAVTCCAFRKDSLYLYTGSADRTVNVYSLENPETPSYVDTHYGHVAPVQCLTALYKERAYTGGSDQTVRVWKIDTQSQLMLKAKNSVASIEAIGAFSSEFLFTGAQDGSVALWSTNRKAPVRTVPNAHGQDNWVSAVACLPASDLAFSGSRDGYLKIWRAGISNNSVDLVNQVPIPGWINGIALSPKAGFACLAVGGYHRLGRWHDRIKAKEGVYVVRLKDTATGAEGSKRDSHDDRYGDEGNEVEVDVEEEDEEEEEEEEKKVVVPKKGKDAKKKKVVGSKVSSASSILDADDLDDEDDDEGSNNTGSQKRKSGSGSSTGAGAGNMLDMGLGHFVPTDSWGDNDGDDDDEDGNAGAGFGSKRKSVRQIVDRGFEKDDAQSNFTQAGSRGKTSFGAKKHKSGGSSKPKR